MSPSAIWNVLAPMAARMPKVVREHEILQVAATISDQYAAKPANAARREVLVWAEKRSGGRLPREAWDHQDFEHFSGGRNSIGVRIERDGADIWAIRADDPDKEVPGRVWTTEVVVGTLEDHPPTESSSSLIKSNRKAKSLTQIFRCRNHGRTLRIGATLVCRGEWPLVRLRGATFDRRNSTIFRSQLGAYFGSLTTVETRE